MTGCHPQRYECPYLPVPPNRGDARTYSSAVATIPDSRPRRIRTLTALFVFLVSALAPRAGLDAASTGRWVTVRTRPGAGAPTVTKYVTARERAVMEAGARMARRVGTGSAAWQSDADVVWHVEATAGTSATWGAQRLILDSLASAVVRAGGLSPGWRVDVVVARSRGYVSRTLAQLRCNADLSRTGGVVLMGATVCGRHVIVMNITGFLFLVRSDQELTEQLETRAEPALLRIPYRLNVRNPGALAHEFAHMWRAAESNGAVPADEPAWFAEGFAEYWAGIATVASRWSARTYEDWHVLRARDFVDWQDQCREPISSYGRATTLGQGCEYHLGLLAVEYLFSRFDSMAGVVEAVRTVAGNGSFANGFRAAFGVSLERFEADADNYIAAVRRASRMVPPRRK